MPIIESVPAESPLTQGDILRGIALFATAMTPVGEEPNADIVSDSLCLVLSRPCVAAHKDHIVVAAVAPYRISAPEIDGFDAMMRFLEGLRDGWTAPDRFYLGEIPSLDGKFTALFDSIHSVKVPTDATDRKDFLANRRVARLTADFARDLHVRLFRAFASLGFDDLAWFSTADLELLVEQGHRDMSAAQTKLSDVTLAKGVKSFASTPNQKLDTETGRATRDLESLRQSIAPYEAELESRRLGSVPPVT